MPVDSRDIKAVEEYFLRSGLPHLAVNYDARSDTLSRLRWPLVGLMVLALSLVIRPEWPLWPRLLVAVGAGGAVPAVVALVNLARGKRPLLARPERMTFVEATALVLAPAAAALVVGDGVVRAVWIAVGSVAAAAALYLVTSMGLVPMFLFLSRNVIEGLADTASVALRAMPPMLAVLLFLFLSTEVWQAFGLVEGWRFTGIVILFALLSAGFVLNGLRRERDASAGSGSRDELAARAGTTPAGPLVAAGVAPVTPRLSRMARFNLVVAQLASVGVRVIAVGVAIALFFMVFGVLAVDRDLTRLWTGEEDPNILVAVSIGGREVVASEALVRVSVLLGAFAALYFSVVAVSVERNRAEFLDDEIERVSAVMAAWAYYRGALAETAAGVRPSA